MKGNHYLGFKQWIYNISHPGGQTRWVEFPVAALFITEWTHDNHPTDFWVTDLLTENREGESNGEKCYCNAEVNMTIISVPRDCITSVK